MNTIIILLCLLALAGAKTYMKKWKQFMAKNEKSYKNTLDEIEHFSSFMKNSKMIKEHNERYRSGLETYEMKMNKYTDFTETEFLNLAGCGAERLERKRTALDILRDFFDSYDTPKVPKSVDWRKRGAVTRVKNQGSCGSCWAFSAVGAIEGQLFRKEGKLVELSEQNLVDCSGVYGNHGCNGGSMWVSFKYVKDNGGINTERSYPYEGKDGKCRFNKENIGAVITGYKSVGQREQLLAAAVAEVGPVSVFIRFSRNWAFYKKGVFYEPNCDSKELHGVLVVGYGRENEGYKEDYWIVKNSWGTTFGDRGYIKMARKRDNNCGIATFASYPVM